MVEAVEMQRSSRDPEQLRVALEGWLATKLPEGAAPSVPAVHGTDTNGQSTETLLFDATWTEDGAARQEALVARVAPASMDVPVFPSYDMHRQYRAMALVDEQARVPVPSRWWEEPDASVLGSPFFVMGRVDGVVPPDVMPYTFGDNWVADATDAQRRRLQDTTVAAIAAVHSIAADDPAAAFLAFDEAGPTPLARHLAHTRGWYEFCAGADQRSPLLERAFRWLEDNLPADEGEPVVSWGDSRIGNVLYRDFAPVAVLDWEMAGVGPRELDVAWLVYSHLSFQDLAGDLGLPGLPGFLRWDDVATEYERVTGHAPRHLRWFGTYAGLQWGIVFLRTGQRSIHFGQREEPAHVDELLMNGPSIERMLDGTYWSDA